jgi:autotransporter-associated beta strand protein
VLQCGTLTLNGTNTVRLSGILATGTFPLVQYTGAIAGSGSFNPAVGVPQGMTGVLSNYVAGSTLYVTVGGSPGIVWTGTNSVASLTNVWGINSPTNWLAAGLPAAYLESAPPGDPVLFNDIGSGVVLLSNTVSPAGVTFSNTLTPYTVQGSGQITSIGGLRKVGAGAVTVNVASTYAGASVISNSAYNIGANHTLANLSGNGTLGTSVGTPTLILSNSVATTYAGPIQGALGLTKIGNGTLTLTATNTFTGNVFGKAGTILLDSGTIFGGGNYSSIGQSGTDVSTLTLKGTSAFTNNADFNVADVGSAVGTMNIQDNATVSVLSLFIASANAAGSTANGTVNMTGGSLIGRNTAVGTFVLGGRNSGNAGNGVGVLNLTNGYVSAASAIRVGDYGTGTINQYGGLVEVTNASTGINLHRQGTAGSGTYNLNGGTLRTEKVTSSQTSGTRLFYFNGGTLQAGNGNLGATAFMDNLEHAYVRNGGAIIDSQGYDIIVSQGLEHSDVSGDAATDGGLVKLGSGKLVMDGYNSYTGTTTVSNGTLAGIGTISGSLVVKSVAALSPGNNSIGTFTVGSTPTLQGSVVMQVDRNGGSPINDLLEAGSAPLVYGGTLVVTNSGADLQVGDSFKLFNTAGGYSGSFTVVSQTPNQTVTWNTSSLTVDGTITVATVGSPIANYPTNITYSVSSGTLSLSWPSTHLGWVLQMQTNSLSKGLSTNWADIAGSDTITSTNISIGTTNPAVFFRLRMP